MVGFSGSVPRLFDAGHEPPAGGGDDDDDARFVVELFES
jgi:hypothetical protein